MVDEVAGSPAPLGGERVGDRLRAAREAAGLTLADIGQRTRIPLRHLEAIETSTYASLPSITYAMGFVRAYARAIGADEVSLANSLRGELSTTWAPKPRHEPYALAEPARVPPRGLAMAGVLVAILIVVGIGLWYGTSIFRGEEAAPMTVAEAPAPNTVTTPVPAPTPSPAGLVRLTATDEVWVRVYDAANDTLLMKTMQKGESYDVPATARGPQINIGRPDKLAVTIDGQAVPPLGSGERPIKDIGISAEALRARAAAGA